MSSMSSLSSLSTLDDERNDERDDEREIKDPVHGYIPVSKLITSIIDTPQFQRLRFLKQLGTSYYVWPGASHNRFEHSLGVFHLARSMVTRLRTAQPDLNITDRDVECVSVAGLCHDLGHGPFSHVWDNTFIPAALPATTWTHEDASETMLDFLVADNNISLAPRDIAFVKDLIAGTPKHTAGCDPPEKPFLFEIVANKRNGIDVDKFDYIARDTRAIGGGVNVDLIRLVTSARVIDGQICYSEKNAATVYGLFQERFKLHKTIYQHKTAKSIEYMIVDALLLADPYLKIADRIHDPKRFVHLNDDILNEVDRSSGDELAPARALIRRIRKRDLYKLVDKTYLPWSDAARYKEHITPVRIAATAHTLSAAEAPEAPGLTAKDVVVDFAELHHGMGDRFPLDNCKFYGKYSRDKAFPPRREEDISHLLPKGFAEVLIRVFTRDCQYFGVIQAAFRKLSSSVPPAARTSMTPEAPTTPRAGTTSMSSIGEPPEQGQGHSFQNNFMTVPPDFTPMKGRKRAAGDEAEEGEGSPKGKGRGRKKKKSA